MPGIPFQRHQISLPETETLRPQPEAAAPFNQVVFGGPGLAYVLSTNQIKEFGGTTSVAIPGNGIDARVRWDLIEVDKDNALNRVAGAIQLLAVPDYTGAPGFPGSVATPTIGSIPLAYVRVTENADPDVDIQADDITDIRSMIGPWFEAAVAGDFLSDLSGGSVGTVRKIFGADHRHPLNVDATAPANLAAAAASGAAVTYAKRDHVHKLPTISTRTLAAASLLDELSADPAGADIADLSLGDATYELEEAELEIVLVASIDDGAAGVEYSAGRGVLKVAWDSVAAAAKTYFSPAFPTWQVNTFGGVPNIPTPTLGSNGLGVAISAGSFIWATNYPGGLTTRISVPLLVTVFATGRVLFKFGATAAWALAGINNLDITLTARATFRKMAP